MGHDEREVPWWIGFALFLSHFGDVVVCDGL